MDNIPTWLLYVGFFGVVAIGVTIWVMVIRTKYDKFTRKNTICRFWEVNHTRVIEPLESKNIGDGIAEVARANGDVYHFRSDDIFFEPYPVNPPLNIKALQVRASWVDLSATHLTAINPYRNPNMDTPPAEYYKQSVNREFMMIINVAQEEIMKREGIIKEMMLQRLKPLYVYIGFGVVALVSGVGSVMIYTLLQKLAAAWGIA